MFDGQGFVIDNLYSEKGGLFGYVGADAVIRSVGVASGEIGSEAEIKAVITNQDGKRVTRGIIKAGLAK